MEIFKNMKKLFGHETVDYSEKIPNKLASDDFDVHHTISHGFPYQPSCIAYDSVQKLLAICSHSGNIALLGKSGLERHIRHKEGVAILQLLFIENKGLFITRCGNDSIYLWSMDNKDVSMLHKLQFQKESPSVLAWPFGSDWFYIGMEHGNTYVCHVEQFQLSGYNIYWDKVVEPGVRRERPGDVVAVEEHPHDPSKLLLGYTHGLCVLWNTKGKYVEKRYRYDEGRGMRVLMSVYWNGSGKHFVAAYSDGIIALFNVKNETHEIITPHEQGPTNCPVSQIQWLYVDPEPWLVYCGGFGESRSPSTITIHHSKTTQLLLFNDPIVQFIALPSSPYPTDYQKPFALATLTQKELVVHDLSDPCFPKFDVPFMFNMQTSPVTTIKYYGNCPDDFIALLHSVQSKMPHHTRSTKRWPLAGGNWGTESPDPWTDVVITGHMDGVIRLWFCRSVIMQPFFSIDTRRYFTSSDRAPSAMSNVSRSPRSSPLPYRSITLSLSSAQSKPSKSSPSDTPTPETPTLDTPMLDIEDVPATPTSLTGEHDKKSRKKTFLKKMKIGNKLVKKLRTSDGGDHTHHDGDVIIEEESEKSPPETLPLQTPTENVSTSSSNTSSAIAPSPSVVGVPSIGTTPSTVGVAPTGTTPSAAAGVSASATSATPTSPNAVGTSPSGVDTSVGTSSSAPPSGMSVTSPSPSKDLPTSPTVGPTSPQYSDRDDDRQAISYINLDMYTQTLCSGNHGGHTLTFEFSVLADNKKQPQSIMINFNEDSVITPDRVSDDDVTADDDVILPSDVAFTNEVDQYLPGFFVIQHCFCYQDDEGTITEAEILCMKYSPHSMLLVIGTDLGLAIINTSSNQCITTLNCLTSILYMACPSEYGRQVRKKAQEKMQLGLVKKQKTLANINPLQKRISSRMLSTPLLQIAVSDANPTILDAPEGEHQVTYIELVQMHINKTGMTLTLWVGTNSGHVGVYSVIPVDSKFEITPTGIVIERKTAIVYIVCLSEYGEQLLTPYKPHRHGKEMEFVLRRRATTLTNNNVDQQRPVDYAVVVSRDTIKCLGFPGSDTVARAEPDLQGNRILDSNFFTCKGLPCLMCLTSNTILVYTLPGLLPMIETIYPPLNDSRSLFTFQVSGDGQGIYMSSPSEVQRLSLIKADQYNLPHCLPDVFVPCETPQPMSKGLLSQLFALGSSTTHNRYDTFSTEAAGKPLRTVARRDDSKTSYSSGYTGNVSRINPQPDGKANPRHDGASSHKKANDGPSNVYQKTRQALDKRTEELSELEQKTQKLSNDATDFADLARRFREKQEKKK